MIQSRICDLFNIQYPIIQGGMAWVATAELAAAVSNAGGLGIIAAGNAPAAIIKNEIDKVKKLTNKPYGVNVMLLSPFVDEIMELIVQERVPVITTGAGNPGKYMSTLKSIGTKVIPVVPSVALAQRMERIGADAIIVEGTEAGGHIGELTTMVLVPQIVDAVSIPVIAAGGIADGRGMLAAFALGAEGVQVGTRFICAEECIAHDNYKDVVLKAKDRDTVVTGRSTGHPVRVVKNKLSKEFEKLEKSGSSPEVLENLGAGKLRLSVIEGDVDQGSVMAGQIAGLVKEIKSCKAIIEDMVDEAKRKYAAMEHTLR
ncbi:enoyl-[acyl-carrier protein] reductase II [Anaerosolibacter carboniphilus]|uniref:Probable nitronate monooxygenase n=1 Tax=Anaerosolibacter carboniphilus TaxID=1417629 RepID=A0A841KWR8_9FIRM|nr:enoyl-[acyl-carrier-protein] reductase FabK [Anaerosolibacter carboniphilus]MBB6217813.1 enoyl-[acyl-carrier protein] reductase II [Anaerosolibacter carboniphilus]